MLAGCAVKKRVWNFVVKGWMIKSVVDGRKPRDQHANSFPFIERFQINDFNGK